MNKNLTEINSTMKPEWRSLWLPSHRMVPRKSLYPAEMKRMQSPSSKERRAAAWLTEQVLGHLGCEALVSLGCH